MFTRTGCGRICDLRKHFKMFYFSKNLDLMKRYIYFFLIFGFNIIHFVLITFEKEIQCTSVYRGHGTPMFGLFLNRTLLRCSTICYFFLKGFTIFERMLDVKDPK